MLAERDTTAGFVDPTSWQTFDTSDVFIKGKYSSDASSFHMGGFDGRFVYFVPLQSSQDDAVIARFDTLQSYTSPDSWSYSPHYSELGVEEQGGGAIFDGQFMYFVSPGDGKIQRFEARTTPSMPMLPAFTGSFF